MAIESKPATSVQDGSWHLRDANELASAHGVDPAHGLHLHEVAQRALQHGPNALPSGPSRSVWTLLWEQFSDFMILVLLGAAVISGMVGDLVDTLVILTIVLLNAVIGLVQAWRADQAGRGAWVGPRRHCVAGGWQHRARRPAPAAHRTAEGGRVCPHR